MRKGQDVMEEGLITPRRGKRDPEVGSDVILVMIPEMLEGLVERTGARSVPFPGSLLYRLYQTLGPSGRMVTLAGPFFGAPHAVMGMEKLIALGCTRFWFLGWCGSLQPDLVVGDVVLPAAAISEEGTSSHYPIDGRFPASDPDLNRQLALLLHREGIVFRKGDIWTTDAPYRETPTRVKGFRSRGVLAVDMEGSALMTVAAFRSVPISGLMVVSDELGHLKWRPGFSSPRLKTASQQSADAVFFLACQENAETSVPEA